MPGKASEFKGVMGRDFRESSHSWPEMQQAAEGAPNILMIVLDDVGYAQIGCYGSDIATPRMDSLAGGGLQYTNFHTTAMCSPTRSCLLTGRNHHSNGMGCISEFATGFPGYDAIIPKENGFLSEILSARGYACYAIGKWHLTPDYETNMAATKERWPLGRGFERFYGFLGGHTDQYQPNLVYDNHQVEPPKSVEEGYHFTEDITDKAVEFITDLKNVDPDKPFFMYFAPGAMHAPHQAPPEWIDKYKGRFDMGWEKWREQIYNRQMETGVIPEGTELPPRPEWIQDWEALEDDHKKLFARFMEVYAGFLEHTDYHIGRLLDFLAEIDQFDNTLIMLVSDNGASSEGGWFGSINESRLYNRAPFTAEENMKHLDKLGGPESYPNYPWGWTWAGNTPLKRWKRETHEGGVTDPMIVHWPQGIKAAGEKRGQYTHAIDLFPTLLEAVGISEPDRINGIEQASVHGSSFASTFDHKDAGEYHLTQYYELMGCRAIYHQGWKAVTWHRVNAMGMEPIPFDEDVWELYHTDEDFSESHDLAEKHPEKLKQLIDLWWTEAGKYNVLPLDDRGGQRFFEPKPDVFHDRKEYIYYPGGSAISEGAAVNLKNRPHSITAQVETFDEGAEGVLLAHGGRFGGYSFYVKGGHLHYVHNFLNIDRYVIKSDSSIPAGTKSLRFEFEPDQPGEICGGGTGRLFIDGKPAGRGEISRTVGVRYHLADDGLCCGYDDESPVSDDYQAPFHFTGTINRVVVKVEGDLVFDQETERLIALMKQ